VRRSQAFVLVALVAGAGLLLLAGGRVWGHVDVPPAQRRGAAGIDVVGGELAAGLSAFALGALAGAGALLATRGRARGGLGVLVALLGLGASGLIVTGVALRATRAANIPRVRSLGTGATGVVLPVSLTGWPFVALLGALLLLVAGLVTTVRGPGWSALSQRYDAPAAQPRPRDPAVAAWDALDRGEDPTAR